MTLAVGYVQEGKNIDYANSTGSTISYNQIIPLTDGIAIAASDIANGETGAIYTEGVFELPAVNNAAFAIGDRLYWDASAGKLTKTATNNTNAGYCVATKAQTGTTANVKLAQQAKEGDSAAITLIGNLDNLETTDKTSVVDSINEVNARIAANLAASTAVNLSTLTLDFNNLLSGLKTAGLMVADA